ncbi:MAG: hypothetical protein ABF624_00865 [Liquorilactobacillus ghanensis]|uniref:hypothetical protein n=1 Tax=Liquorilactobacillus ghanensis TaxID=399370 RepID=UPI0039EA5B7D
MATVYRDSTPLTNEQRASLQGCATAIRTKMYGKDVRDAIAAAIELVGMPGIASYFTPKGVKDNLAALKAAFPSGTDGIYITKDDGYWCFWDGTSWQKGNVYQGVELADGSTTYVALDDILKKQIFSMHTAPSNSFSRGLFTESFSVLDTIAWAFMLIKVKSTESYSVTSVTDQSQPVLILFDENFNVVDKVMNFETDEYKVNVDGYLAINCYVGGNQNVNGALPNVKITGNTNSSLLKGNQIADESALTVDGFLREGFNVVPESAPMSKDDYKTTDYIPVTSDSYLLITAFLGVNNGVIGYESNSESSAAETLLATANSNEFVQDFLIKIPANIKYIKVSTNINYPFRIYETSFPVSTLIETHLNKISFDSPSAAGTTGVQVKDYFPFSTERTVISDVFGNAFAGIAYGDEDLGNSLRVRLNNSSCVAELYVAGKIVQTATFSVSKDPRGRILQVQNTGRALIILLFEQNMSSFMEIGKFDFGKNFDARQEELTYKWKTYLIAYTPNASSADSASFNHFDSAIRSGANSVSTRFLTYEDGTFIQKGNWMYFLVEGTGESVSDLFTQIVKINFKTYEVQSIGAIFEERNDGTDSGILLGDDSIKMVYDRNDGKWKGISCGMEYNDYISDTGNRPKLYFETTQNILDGGIIIVRNAQQITDTNGKKVGTSETSYTEDFDFYYDSENKYWVVTGNKISGGYMIYHTPDLKTNYSVALDESSVPDGVRDTGNQFVNFAGTRYLTTGGTTNSLGIRDMTGNYLGALNVDVPLSSTTAGPWCTLVPFLDGDIVNVFLLSFDRVNLLNGGYDHGSLYCWKGFKSAVGATPASASATANDLSGTVAVNFPAGSPLDYTYYRQFARRDFYNENDSFGEYKLDLNTDLLKSPSNVLAPTGNNFTQSLK